MVQEKGVGGVVLFIRGRWFVILRRRILPEVDMVRGTITLFRCRG
jgi:hypothetical protein